MPNESCRVRPLRSGKKAEEFKLQLLLRVSGYEWLLMESGGSTRLYKTPEKNIASQSN